MENVRETDFIWWSEIEVSEKAPTNLLQKWKELSRSSAIYVSVDPDQILHKNCILLQRHRE